MSPSPQEQAYCLALGARVTRLRGSRTQAEIAAAAGLSQSTLSKIEQGHLAPSAYKLGRLGVVLGTTSGDLDASAWAILDQATRAASVVYRTQITPETIADLPGINGLITFVAAVEEEST